MSSTLVAVGSRVVEKIDGSSSRASFLRSFRFVFCHFLVPIHYASLRMSASCDSFASTSAWQLDTILPSVSYSGCNTRHNEEFTLSGLGHRFRRIKNIQLLPPVTSSFTSQTASPSTNEIKNNRLAVCETDDLSSHASTSASKSKAQGTPIDKQSWNYILRSGLAGGVAGCIAKTAIAPLDRVKILFQAQNPEFQKYSGKWLGVFTAGKEIVNTQGTMALFQGHSATLLRIFPYAAIKYMAYDKLHFILMPTKASETSSKLFLAGSASGVLSVFLTYPLELIRVRLAFETKRKKHRGSLAAIVKKIYSEGATEAPFSGDARKRANRIGGSIPTANLSTSAIQNAAIANGATVASPIPASPLPSAAVVRAQWLLQTFPFFKFYRGFTVTVMGMIPYAGTSFLVFGKCKTIMQDTFMGEDANQHRKWWWPSKTVIDLGSGALAGAISQTTAYPFEVIRRRQQVGGIIRPANMLGMKETALWIWRTSGWRGFYVGLSIGFLKVVPMTSISFAVWLGMKRSMNI